MIDSSVLWCHVHLYVVDNFFEEACVRFRLVVGEIADVEQGLRGFSHVVLLPQQGPDGLNIGCSLLNGFSAVGVCHEGIHMGEELLAVDSQLGRLDLRNGLSESHVDVIVVPIGVKKWGQDWVSRGVVRVGMYPVVKSFRRL